MAVRRTVVRLLRLRQLEEEQSRMDLEAAVVVRTRAEEHVAAAAGRQAQGRSVFVAGMLNPLARTGGLLAMEQGRKKREHLQPALEAAEAQVESERKAYLERRAARRQVETLVENARRAAEEVTARRVQQMLDDWYGRRGRDVAGGHSKAADPKLADLKAADKDAAG